MIYRAYRAGYNITPQLAHLSVTAFIHAIQKLTWHMVKIGVLSMIMFL